MTVQELIDQLSNIEDKTSEVKFCLNLNESPHELIYVWKAEHNVTLLDGDL